MFILGLYMEYRKLIKFGNSSFVVSLPKTWMEKNDLKKGDTIYLEENGNNELIVLPKEKEIKKEEKSIVIETDGKEPKYINREIVTAYLNDYNLIKLSGSNISQISSIIKERVNNLMACEIMEHNHEYIICRDFLDVINLSYHELIRKMDNTVRSMLYDLDNIQNLKNDLSFKERCNDVNRTSFVVFRLMKSSIKKPNLNKTQHTNYFDSVYWWFVASKIEYISEGLRNIGIYIFEKDLNKSKILIDKEFIEIIGLLNRLYENAMKSFYKGDKVLAMTVSDLKYIFNEKCDKFQLKYNINPCVGVLMERYIIVVKLINIIARWVFSN